MDREQRTEAIMRLYEQGHGCNAIARAIPCSPGTVTHTVRNNGGTFNNNQTKAATQARIEAAKAAAAETADHLIEDIQALRARAWAPTVDYIATDDGVQEIHRPLPSPTDTRHLTNSIESTARSIERLRAISGPSTTNNTQSILGTALATLAALVEQDRDETGGI